jgi:hypothetical protein
VTLSKSAEASALSASKPLSAAGSSIRSVFGKSIASLSSVWVKPRRPFAIIVMSRKARKLAESSTANRPIARKRRSDA